MGAPSSCAGGTEAFLAAQLSVGWVTNVSGQICEQESSAGAGRWLGRPRSVQQGGARMLGDTQGINCKGPVSPGDFAFCSQEKLHKISYMVSSAPNSIHWPGEVVWAEMCCTQTGLRFTAGMEHRERGGNLSSPLVLDAHILPAQQ